MVFTMNVNISLHHIFCFCRERPASEQRQASRAQRRSRERREGERSEQRVAEGDGPRATDSSRFVNVSKHDSLP